jgi:transmembrane sensor
MDEAYYRQLVKRYLEKKVSDDELEVFAHLLGQGKLDAYLDEAMHADEFTADVNTANERISTRRIAKNRLVRLSYAAAALILLTTMFGVYNFIKNDFLPGTSKAILTLANGSQLSLTGGNNGLLAHQGSTAINKKEEGKVEYNSGANQVATNEPEAATLYNTVSTPKGGQYRVNLPDGTKVWLNTASSIRFPTEFAGNNRQVTISGEVYFEVAKNKEKPFIVTVVSERVTVLGTHFNINAYAEENTVKTTLLEGSVKVSNGNDIVFLKPGQQAKLTSENKLMVDNDIDTDEVIAWKNGFFQFNKADITTIMNQISRWYDVDVQYTGQVQPGHYYGKISRNVNASKVLKVLELSGMHFTIEGGKIIVK